jgi:hypothetical protein
MCRERKGEHAWSGVDRSFARAHGRAGLVEAMWSPSTSTISMARLRDGFDRVSFAQNSSGTGNIERCTRGPSWFARTWGRRLDRIDVEYCCLEAEGAAGRTCAALSRWTRRRRPPAPNRLPPRSCICGGARARPALPGSSKGEVGERSRDGALAGGPGMRRRALRAKVSGKRCRDRSRRQPRRLGGQAQRS